MSSSSSTVRRGYLLNDSTGRKEYFVLRRGVLRSYRSDRGELLKQIHLAHSGEVNLLHDGVLELKAHAPYTWEYTLVAPSEEDAELWYDLFQSCIIESQKQIQNQIELLRNGAQLVKYNYSNYKRTRRLFWISDTGDELRWGKTKSVTDFSKVDLRDCIGIIYGPVTTTFLRCNSHNSAAASATAGGPPQQGSSSQSVRDAGFCCFSLLFMGRTLDLATYGDMINVWFLGLQYLITRYASAGQSMPTLSDSQFLIKKAQYKVAEKAHQRGLVYSRYFLSVVKELGTVYANKGPQEFYKYSLSRGSYGTGGGGFAPLPRSPERPSKLAAPKALPGIRSADQLGGQRGNGSVAQPQQTTELELELKKLAAENERLKKLLENSGKNASAKPGEKSANEVFMQERCSDLEANVIQMQQAQKEQTQQIRSLTDEAAASSKKLATTQEALQKAELENAKIVRSCEQLKEENKKHKDSAAEKDAQIKNLGEKVTTLSGQTSKISEQLEKSNKDLMKQVEQLTASNRRLGEEKQQHLEKATALEQKLERTTNSKNVVVSRLSGKVKDLQLLHTELKSSLSVELRQFQDTYMTALARNVKQMAASLVGMQDSFKNIQAERRRLHNLVLELKGNIRVFARVRPLVDSEVDSEPKNGTKTVMFQEETKLGVYNDYDARKKWFEFDRVFYPGSTQEEVFAEAQPLATSVLDGYNVCIFAYGQTGSGKTHTMRGPGNNPGLYVRVLSELFRLVDEKKQSNRITMKMLITEIYNETLKDLLPAGGNPGNGEGVTSTKKVDVKLQQDGSVQLTNVEEISIRGMADVSNLMAKADTSRAVAQTDMNEHSSRSHQIVTIKIDNESLETGSQYFGKIHLIDLAGSENVGKSGATGQTLKEAQNINKSLSALGDVISSLMNKSGHVPYRNSKLTMMLKDSLGGDAKMLMIVQCSPAQMNVTETLSTLSFAQRARTVELGKAKRNVRNSGGGD